MGRLYAKSTRDHCMREHKRGVDVNDVGYIYLMSIEIKGKKYIKIGKTINPTKRLMTYNSTLPFPIFEYYFVSSKMYNISNIENNIIDIMNHSKSVYPVGNRLEWFEPKRGRLRTTSVDNYMNTVIVEIEKYEDSYYEE